MDNISQAKTLRELARTLGLAPSVLSRIATKRRLPDAATLLTLVKALDDAAYQRVMIAWQYWIQRLRLYGQEYRKSSRGINSSSRGPVDPLE